MTYAPRTEHASIYFASVSKYVKNVFTGLGLMAFFALFHFIPFADQPILRISGYAFAAFFLYLTIFSAMYVFVRRPSLVLDHKGIRYRVSVFKTILVPWQNVQRVAIEASSASFRGKTLSSRFLSIYPKDRSPIIKELPLVQRFFAWISVRMGYSPLSISEPIVDAPLESVANAIYEYAKKFGGMTPSNRFQVTSALTHNRT